ncbi:MAG: glycosyltransferase family 2 protein [Cytophagales bacterium]|nr:MAG: glycosyltransferase family 2 protein [Cytophagales bacterium]
MNKTAVVILNWNGIKHLKQFLPSVTQFSPEAEIYVADNGSSDQSIEFLKEFYPTIKIVALEKNYGFCEGYNKALSQINAKYYVLLNSDVEVTPNWLPPLISELENNPNIAACQPKILNYLQKDQFEYAGAAGGQIDILGFPYCRGRKFDKTEQDKGQYNDKTKIFWASGACLCIRSDVYHQNEGLDNSFFAHMEEIDFCWRLINQGYTIYYTAQSTVYHLGGGTLNKNNPAKTYLNFRNNLFLLHKNLPSKYLLIIIFTRMVIDGLLAFFLLFQQGKSHFIAVIKAHIDYYKNIQQLNQKRKKLKNNTIPNEIYRGSILIEHLIKKK